MKFTKIEDNAEINLECNDLNNDILFRKYQIKENNIVLLKENQFLILSEKGKILDIEEEVGKYKIEEGNSNKVELFKEWQDLNIAKSEEEPLSVIFLNRRIINKNKYFIEEPIKYIEYTENEEKEYYIKISGSYDFYIENPKVFLGRVIGLRNHFSKQELIEQIRKHVVKSIEKGISELSEEYKLDIETIETKSKELKIKLSQNDSDKKLLEYGIKLNYFDIDTLEIVEKKKRFLFKRKK